MRYNALLHPTLPPLFQYWIPCPPGQTYTPTSLHRLSLRLLPCCPRPALQRPSRHLNHCATWTFIPSLPLYVLSPFAALNVPMCMSNRVVFHFLVLSFRHHWLKPLPSQASLNLRPGPCCYRWYFCLKYIVYFLTLISSTSSPAIVMTCLLIPSGVLYSLLAPFCALTRGQGASTPWQFPTPALVPTIIGRSSTVQAAQLPPHLLFPTLVLLIPLPSVDLGGLWRWNATAQFAVIVGAARLVKARALWNLLILF